MTHDPRKRRIAAVTFLSRWFCALCPAIWFATPASAADAGRVGVVSHVKVLSNHVEDVSSPEAWAQSRAA